MRPAQSNHFPPLRSLCTQPVKDTFLSCSFALPGTYGFRGRHYHYILTLPIACGRQNFRGAIVFMSRTVGTRIDLRGCETGTPP